MTKAQYLSKIFTSEDQFQAATHRFINVNYAELRHFYFHVPNESATSDQMRMKLCAMGVLPGVPDIIFLKPYVWCMELKMIKGIVSDRQKALHELWRSIGIKTYVCRSQIEVINVLQEVL